MEPTKVLFIPTSNAGISYWRMWNFAIAMHRCQYAQAQVLWYDKHCKDLNKWEMGLTQARAENSISSQFVITNDMWGWIRQSDAIIFGMIHSNAGLDIVESVIELRNKGNLRNVPVLMELDDNILSIPTANPAFNSYEPGTNVREVALRQMKISDAIIVSTPYLQEIYSDFNPHVHVIPNSIDFDLWGKLKNQPRRGIRIGWAGGAAHADDLELLAEVIPEIIETYPDVVFCFVHGISRMIKDMAEKYPQRIEVIRTWSEIDEYPKFIASLDWDIALAPLLDSSFNRAKSNLRWLEAGALGIPCVASKVGHFASTLIHAEDAMLCDPDESARDFIHNIGLLVHNGSLRRRIGRAAREKILRDFNVDKTSKKYVDVLIAESNRYADSKIPPLKEGDYNEPGTTQESDVALGRGPGPNEVCKLLPGCNQSGASPVLS